MAATSLMYSRRQLHAAVRLIAVVGTALGPQQPYGCQRACSWDAGQGRLVGTKIPGVYPFCVALQPIPFTMLVLDDQETVVAQLALTGRPPLAVLRWLQGELAQLGAESEKLALFLAANATSESVLPSHRAFETGSRQDREQLIRYFANTQPLLRTVAASNAGAFGPYIWPENFNMTTQIELPAAGDESPFIRVGLSPGSDCYPLPHWYIQPHPSLEPERLPPLPRGQWSQGSAMAVLQASDVSLTHPSLTRQQVQSFFNQGVIRCEESLLSQNLDGYREAPC